MIVIIIVIVFLRTLLTLANLIYIYIFPRNPIGRTGMIGRGLLGRWGPNHAADPVVTRYTLKQL